MTMLRPAWMAPATGDTDAVLYSAQEDRAGVLASIFSREGVLDLLGGHLQVVARQEGANFSVDVLAGRAAIRGDDISDQGVYVVTATTKENRTVPAPPASGSRRHRVVARVRDKIANSSWAVLDWTIEVLADPGTGTPPEPPSADTLAFVTVPAGAVAVTDAMVSEQRTQATVGTADLLGPFTVLTPDYAAQDASRPLRWSVNADGWVSLAGWIRFTKPNAPIYAGVTYQLTDTPLPAPVRPPAAGAYRDMVGIASYGAMHLALSPAGHLTYRNAYDTQLVQNQSWWSFDGIGWKL